METMKAYFNDLNKDLIKNYYILYTYLSNSERFTDEELHMVTKAYLKASQLHSGVKRYSGDPYIIHPINVAYSLAKYGFDCSTICAGLLHDTVEDTKYTIEELKNDFNDEIAELVDGVTKMKKTNFSSREESKIATQRKILESITKDARIIAIKLADRKHNLLTLESMSDEKQQEKALETKEFYVPISRNLGMYQMKDELEDLSLYYLDPESYEKYYEIRKNLKKEHYDEAVSLGTEASDIAANYNMPMDYNYKVKNVAGIHKEIENGRKLNQIHDLIAVRMMVEEPIQCYGILGIVHSISTPVQGSVVDYIAKPKYNEYSSLNTNVIVNDESEFQVRIRTYDMQKVNQLGIVSNWNQKNQQIINEMCMSLIELNNSALTDKEYVDASKKEFLKMNITVKSPLGAINLKESSTGYDYINKVGINQNDIDKFIVNNLVISLDTTLNDGDFINVIKKKKILRKEKKRKQNEAN